MKVAQLIAAWVIALALGVIAATCAWTTWLEDGGELSDAERAWCGSDAAAVPVYEGAQAILWAEGVGSAEREALDTFNSYMWNDPYTGALAERGYDLTPVDIVDPAVAAGDIRWDYILRMRSSLAASVNAWEVKYPDLYARVCRAAYEARTPS